ncbi:MAG: alkaline phosphatase family protein [Actinomycetota bacterium]|nr:alkaline phosphatase family protein [Actinomycetota bacterium]
MSPAAPWTRRAGAADGAVTSAEGQHRVARSVLHRHTSGTSRQAGPLEQVASRAWNVLNEGQPFTAVFALFLLIVTGAPLGGILAAVPLGLAWWRHPYPLHLRAVLWPLAAVVVVAAGGLPTAPALLGLVSYLGFTVVLWGSVYYHLRLGAPWTNFTRFWRLVLENPDPTSGNLLEQLPKVAALLAVGHSSRPAPVLLAAGGGAWIVGAVVHRKLVTWVPGRATGNRREDRRPREAGPALCGPPSRKVVLIVIDGCRADRLDEARTPFLDRLAAEGVSYRRCQTVYPARTVTCFSSMLTGAPPAVHGMRSNFVPSLGVKCESIFDTVPSSRLVGIAHLVDAFGDRVSTVTAVMPNDEIDAALCAKAREVVEAEDPDLLVVQTLSVDQTGHFRGSYYDEYLHHIETTDAEVERLVWWLAERWGGLDGVTIGVLADHGQGRGIGGHGHWTPTERLVPCIWWGEGVPDAPLREDASVLDVAPTLAHRTGSRVPARSVGQCLLCDGAAVAAADDSGPVVVFLPVHDEAHSVADVVARVPAHLGGHPVEVVVVDDGSTDGSAEAALGAGAQVVAHDSNRGLGAALRTGLDQARRQGAVVAAFLDGDGEYDPDDLERLVAPVLAGRADYVVGSRFAGTIESMLPHRRLGNHLLTLLTSAVARRRLSDAQSGCRALGRQALHAAHVGHDYNYAQVLTLDLLGKGFRYAEVPIRYRRRTRGRSYVRLGRYLWRVLPAMAVAARTR